MLAVLLDEPTHASWAACAACWLTAAAPSLVVALPALLPAAGGLPSVSKAVSELRSKELSSKQLCFPGSAGELVTRANGDASDRVGRPVELGQRGIVDPQCRLIGMHLYDGLFKASRQLACGE